MAAYPPPTTYLDTTPPGLSQADEDQFRDDREVVMNVEIGPSPILDPNDPNSVAEVNAFRLNRINVLGELVVRSRAMRISLAAVATAGVAPPPAMGVQPPANVGAGPQANVPMPLGLTRPLCGGISMNFGVQMVWTGGGRRGAASHLTEPKSILAYRPNDFKEHARIVKECQTGLSEEHRLGLPQDIFGETGISFRLWNQKIKTELEDRGMDGEFRIIKTATTETYLLEEFGKANHDDVVLWIDQLRYPNPCRYEEQNMKMSAKFLLASITVPLLEMVERNIRENAAGPEVYTAIVNLHQRVSTSAVRKLIDMLEKLSLKNEPGEDVQKFCGKVTDIAKRIIGTGSPPNDLVALIYKPFTKCSVETFRNAANGYYEKADEMDPAYDNWETWLLKLQMRYQRDCDNGDWEPLKHNKESAAMSGPVSTGSDTRTCYHCGKPGHIKPHCPDKDKPAVSGSGGNRSGLRIAPEEGAPQTKLIDGVSHSWCGVCKRWNNGKKAHLTNEHKARAKSAEEKVTEAPVVSALVSTTAPVESAAVANVGSVNHHVPFTGNGFMGYVGAIDERVAEEPPMTLDYWLNDLEESDFRDWDLDEENVFPEEDLSEEAILDWSLEEDFSKRSSGRHLNFFAGRR